MKRKFKIPFPFFILILSILACSVIAPREVPTPTADLATTPGTTQTDAPTVTDTLPPEPTETPTNPPSETPTDSPTNTPTETLTALPQSTATPTFTPIPDLSRIRFETGGTWAEVVGDGQANKLSTFILRALQGQVMSVSVFEGPGYIITVAGADGKILTPPNQGNYFWRGILPSNQDYLISVQAPFDSDFTLRVAINPVGQSEQTFEYTNSTYDLSLEYSDAFAPVEYPYAFLQRGDPALALNVVDMSFYDNTNLSEAFFALNIFDDLDVVTNCYAPYYEQEQAAGQVTFNGITFEKSTGVGVGAGNIYEQIIYRTVENNACIEVVFFMHSGNIGNYTPGMVTEFDREALVQLFDSVLETLILN